MENESEERTTLKFTLAEKLERLQAAGVTHPDLMVQSRAQAQKNDRNRHNNNEGGTRARKNNKERHMETNIPDNGTINQSTPRPHQGTARMARAAETAAEVVTRSPKLGDVAKLSATAAGTVALVSLAAIAFKRAVIDRYLPGSTALPIE